MVDVITWHLSTSSKYHKGHLQETDWSEPAPVKQKPRKKIMEKYLGAKWLSKRPQWGPFSFIYKNI